MPRDGQRGRGALCLRCEGDAEEVEGALLQRGGPRQDSDRQVVAKAHGVAGQCGEVGQERTEAVDRLAVVSFTGTRLGAGGGRDLGGGDGRGSGYCGGRPVVILEQQRRQRPAHVPGDVIGEHAEKDMRPHPAGEAMVHGADLEVDRLERAEGALDPGEALVGEDCRAGIEILRRHRGAQDIEAVERRLTGDRRLVAREVERLLGDGPPEVLGHLAPARRRPSGQSSPRPGAGCGGASSPPGSSRDRSRWLR